MKKNVYYLILIIWSIIFINSANPDQEFIIKLAEKFNQYNQNYASECVYVHLDKQLYKPGEYIWFKAYISSTFFDDFSALSNDLYIRVYDVFGNEILWERYPIENNTANGCLAIPNSTAEGKYILAAFTGWMKNMEVTDVYPYEIIISKYIGRQLLIDLKFVNSFYTLNEEIKADLKVQTKDHQPAIRAKYSYTVNAFDDVITKGNGETNDEGLAIISFKLPGYATDKLVTLNVEVKYSGENESIVKLVSGVNNNVSLKFYPEGGNIIAGLENRIAFRATDSYGFPFDFEGNVYNGNNELVTQIKSNYEGTGIFKLNPELDLYKVKITRPERVDKEFNLPEVSDYGLTLTYMGVKDNNIVLNAKSNRPGEIEETCWIGRMNNKIYWGTIIKLIDARTVEIPLINFPSGIVQINVFNSDKLPLAERLIYVNKTKETDIKAHTNKLKYGPREKVTVKLSAETINTDTFKANISLSVADKNLVNNFNSLFNSHLVNYQLSEESADFISRLDYPISIEDIDLLMMTSKLKGISYSDVLNTDIFKKTPYYKQDGLSGMIIDKKGNPVRKARIKFIHAPDMQIYETTSDENGIFNLSFGGNIINFRFLTLNISDELISQISQILIDNTFSDQVVEYFEVNNEDWDIQKTIDLIIYNNPKIIYSGKYQRTRGNKISFEQKKKYDKIHYSSYTRVLDIINEMKQFTLINNQIVFQGGINSLYNQQGALIVLDGIQVGTDVNILESLSTSDIENINISTNVADIHAYTGLNSQGIIEITTIKGQDNIQAGTAKENDFNKVLVNNSEFYSPDYEIETGTSEDLRTTIYWNHDLTISSGKEITISFYTSDIKGEFMGIVEGISNNGIAVTAEFRYIVE